MDFFPGNIYISEFLIHANSALFNVIISRDVMLYYTDQQQRRPVVIYLML